MHRAVNLGEVRAHEGSSARRAVGPDQDDAQDGGGPVTVQAIDWFFQRADWWHLLSVPVFTGVVGFLINWTGLVMLFSPVSFKGVTVPGMRQLSRVLPRKIQEVPGILQGGIGWQGIVPARAAKMGSIAVDKAIAKLGTPQEFYTSSSSPTRSPSTSSGSSSPRWPA